jgi:hypothetical protein
VYIADVYISDIVHIIPEVAKAFGSSGHLQIGQYAWSDGKNIVIERIRGENSGDVGIELDVPCILNDCWITNSNDTAYLFNTFNVATTQEPVVAKTTALAKAGESTVTVSGATTAFAIGSQVIVDATAGSTSEVRTIKALGASTIEFTTPLSEEHAIGIWVQEVGDTGAVSWKARNLTAIRTAQMPGLNHGLTVQNAENIRPAPAVYVDGYRYFRRVKGMPTYAGEVISCGTGTKDTPTGNPHALYIRNVQADIQEIENADSENVTYEAIYLAMRGPACPIEISGELNVEGPGATSTGKLQARLVHIAASGILDLDIMTKFVIGSSGGESWRCIEVNQESYAGDITGRIRHRTRKSTIEKGGGTLTGLRLGKGCGFASSTSTALLKGGELSAKATVIPVTSTEGFAVGMAIVVDALNSSKSEVFIISSIAAGESITIVSAGKEPGTLVAHTEPCTIAALEDMLIEDCDWFGLGTAGTAISVEDENVCARLRTRGNTYPAPPTPQTITLPGSGNVFQILQKGQSGTVSVEEGTVTSAEWSADGKNFYKLAATTGTFHVSPGDFVKLAYSSEPKVKFVADRV